jgi:hypothetical protein
MLELALYVGGGVVFFFTIFYGTKWLAKTFGTTDTPHARSAFEQLDGFTVTDQLTYVGSSIAWDAHSKQIAIWEKKKGARIVKRKEVGGWLSGTLVSFVLGRATTTPMVELYASKSGDQPFFKVGVLDKKRCKVWAEYLGAAFGADKDREIAARVVGLN